jgi:glycosyltransferase involved in cell wall biosynthesis
VKSVIQVTIFLVFIPVVSIVALFVRVFLSSKATPRILCGSVPILNFSYYSKALREMGFQSDSFVTNCFEINKAEDWDIILSQKFTFIHQFFKSYMAFIYVLFRYDLFITSFEGVFVGGTPFAGLQFVYLHLAGKKIVILPYGSDGYIYRRVALPRVSHCLQIDYGLYSRSQTQMSKNIDRCVKYADALVPGIMSFDGYGRWDALLPSHLFIDINIWKRTLRANGSDGTTGEVVVAHTPNHRGVKGTEYIIEAVSTLQKEGLNVKLELLEGVPNDFIRNRFSSKVDILVEQLNGYGYALSGLEGMASGLPVISSPQNNDFIEPFRLWSYFDECPIVGSSSKLITSDLRKLVVNPDLRNSLGNAGREYVEKYHGLDSAQFFFRNVIDYVYGKKKSLMNLYHPLTGEYPNRSPKIQHPLVNNQIVD